METKYGHFDLHTSEELYEKAVHDYQQFFDHPNSWALFNLLTTFTHLLEWICPEAGGKPPKSTFIHGTPQQQFYYQLWNQYDYQQIRALCYNSKHFHHKLNGPNTSVVEGARAGLLRAGDYLGQTYYIVNDEDVRDILMKVYRSFKGYFDGVISTGSNHIG